MTSKAVGDILEERIARILSWEGRLKIRRNVHLTDRFGNRSEVDVLWGLFVRHAVECKHYAPDRTISLDAVAKFKEVLALNGIPPHRGLFVTTSSFAPRARTIGIRTMDGTELAAWERRARARRSTRRLVAASALGVFALLIVTFASWKEQLPDDMWAHLSGLWAHANGLWTQAKDLLRRLAQ